MVRSCATVTSAGSIAGCGFTPEASTSSSATRLTPTGNTGSTWLARRWGITSNLTLCTTISTRGFMLHGCGQQSDHPEPDLAKRDGGPLHPQVKQLYGRWQYDGWGRLGRDLHETCSEQHDSQQLGERQPHTGARRLVG